MNKQHGAFGFEVKAVTDGPEMTFSGYGAVFGNVDAYGDVIVKGAFRDTLADAKTSGNWPVMLLQHGGWEAESQMPVGAWTNFEEDDHGLFVEGKFANTQRGQEAYELLKMTPRPAFSGLSIGYFPVEWTNRSKPEEPRRTLKKIKLVEVSLVTFPANDKARVLDVKSARPSDFERRLRDAHGLSRKEAAAFMSGGWKALQSCWDNGEADDYSELAAIVRRNIKTFSGDNV